QRKRSGPPRSATPTDATQGRPSSIHRLRRRSERILPRRIRRRADRLVGFYIVKPQYRGRGFGRQLWEAAMVYLGGHNLGLDGVIAQQGNYRKSGFKLAYRNIRYQGEGGGAEPSGLLDLSCVDFGEIARYDETVFPAARPSFLRRWICQPQGAAFGI